MKRKLISLIIKDIEIKTRYHFLPIRMAKTKTEYTNFDKDMEKLESLYNAGRNVES
jgi:hypothetical protein